MRAIVSIARLEVLLALRDRRLVALTMALSAVVLASMLLGWRDATLTARDRAEAQALDDRIWDTQGDKNPHTAAHFGKLVLKPVGPYGHFDRGMDPYFGSIVYVEGHKQNFAAARPVEDFPDLLRLGDWSPAYLLQVALPLLIVLLGCHSVVRDRTQGTLALMRTLGPSRVTLAAGKILGVLGAALAASLPALVTMAILGVASPGPTASSLAPLFLMILAYALYVVCFVAVSVAVSAWATNGTTALVALAGLWFFLVLLLPRASASVALALHPTPAAGQFLASVEADLARFTPESKYQIRLREVTQELLSKHGVTRVEDLPFNFSGVSLQVLDEVETLAYQRAFDDLWSVYEAQSRFELGAGFLSPLPLLRHASMVLAGSSTAQHHAFATAVEAYRRAYVKFLNDEMRDHAGTLDFDYKVGQDFWERVPEFQYPGLSTDATLRAAMGSLLALFGWCIASLLLAGFALTRLGGAPTTA